MKRHKKVLVVTGENAPMPWMLQCPTNKIGINLIYWVWNVKTKWKTKWKTKRKFWSSDGLFFRFGLPFGFGLVFRLEGFNCEDQTEDQTEKMEDQKVCKHSLLVENYCKWLGLRFRPWLF
jgi:hypothetical protein